MSGYLCRITADDLDALRADESVVPDLIYPHEGRVPDDIDIDKAWHGLHFLFTGDVYGGSGPLALAVLGGTPVGDDLGYGPVRYLTVAQVAEVAEALAALSEQDLTDRFDAAQFTSNDIYPDIWDEQETALDYLLGWFGPLRAHYATAAAGNQAMLLYIS